MARYEYDIEEFALVDKWSAKKQQEKKRELVNGLNDKGSQGWELLGLHAFDLVGGLTGSKKGNVTLTLWKRELAAN